MCSVVAAISRASSPEQRFQAFDPCTYGSFGELDLAHVALGKHEPLAFILVQNEGGFAVVVDDALLNIAGQVFRRPGVRDNPAARLNNPKLEQTGNNVNHTAAAYADGFRVRYRFDVYAVPVETHFLYSALCRAHAAGKLGTFEGGTRRRRAREHPLA